MSEQLHLAEIYDLAWRYVPATSADDRLYTSSPCSWWPAHEIGHFLVATPAECRHLMFGVYLDEEVDSIKKYGSSKYGLREFRYMVSREVAATSISQRLLRRAGHGDLADEEIQYTTEATIECSFERWCKRSVDKLLRMNKVARLPTTSRGLETLLARKARDVGTTPHASLRAARETHRAAGADRR